MPPGSIVVFYISSVILPPERRLDFLRKDNEKKHLDEYTVKMVAEGFVHMAV